MCISTSKKNQKFQEINKTLKQCCDNSFHSVEQIKQELRIKHNHIMNNLSNTVVWSQVHRLRNQSEEHSLNMKLIGLNGKTNMALTRKS